MSMIVRVTYLDAVYSSVFERTYTCMRQECFLWLQSVSFHSAINWEGSEPSQGSWMENFVLPCIAYICIYVCIGIGVFIAHSP